MQRPTLSADICDTSYAESNAWTFASDCRCVGTLGGVYAACSEMLQNLAQTSITENGSLTSLPCMTYDKPPYGVTDSLRCLLNCAYCDRNPGAGYQGGQSTSHKEIDFGNIWRKDIAFSTRRGFDEKENYFIRYARNLGHVSLTLPTACIQSNSENARVLTKRMSKRSSLA